MGEKENLNKNSDVQVKRKNSKAKTNAVATWEWFKSAAWLQVLLIVAVVVGLVISIPYIVSAVKSATTNNTITFFEDHRINYDRFQKFINGEDKDCNGVVGNDNSQWSENNEGFVVMFYKDNCDNCTTMQSSLDWWYSKTNTEASGRLRFYTINVGWVPGDKDASTTSESNNPATYYKNEDITLQQQVDLMQNAFRDVYLNQDDGHKNSTVKDSNFEIDYTAIESSDKTIPTPCFVQYSKAKTEEKYNLYKPTKVIFGTVGKYTPSNKTDVIMSMYDIYNFSIYHEESNITTNTSASSASSAS